MNPIYSFLSVIVFVIGLYFLMRHSFKSMNKEMDKAGSAPNPWTHIFILELLVLGYVAFNLVSGCVRAVFH